MKSTKINGLSILKQMLIMSLCLIMLIGSALAQNVNVKEFYEGDNDYLFFVNTLSDGRLLFGGSKCLDESKDITRKWLLCLNPDRTVNWEYISPEEEASTVFAVSERPDGTIAVLFDMGDEDHEAPEGARTKIRYFTQSGQATGKETDLPGIIQSKTNDTSCLVQMFLPTEEDNKTRYIITDWDGNPLDENNEILSGKKLFYEEIKGGILLYDSVSAKDGRARIIKKESLEGKPLWSVTLDPIWTGTSAVRIDEIVNTKDGGCTALVCEGKAGDSDSFVWKYALLKLDTEGNVQWTYKDETEKESTNSRIMIINRKIVLYSAPDQKDEKNINTPRVFQWFDLEGNHLGNNRLYLQNMQFPAMVPYLTPENGNDTVHAVITDFGLLSSTEELWVFANACACSTREDGTDEIIVGSEDYVSIQIKEPR